jgi:hypothetical protein
VIAAIVEPRFRKKTSVPPNRQLKTITSAQVGPVDGSILRSCRRFIETSSVGELRFRDRSHIIMDARAAQDDKIGDNDPGQSIQ